MPGNSSIAVKDLASAISTDRSNPTVNTDTRTDEEKKASQDWWNDYVSKASSYAPAKPVRLDHGPDDMKVSGGAPPAQGFNISKEEAEYAANLSKAGVTPEPEKTPASTEVPPIVGS